MVQYRLYFMDPANGHILHVTDYEAPNLDVAIEFARENAGERPIELWSGHDKILRIEAEPSLTAEHVPQSEEGKPETVRRGKRPG